jgi:hypothetical protein
MNAYTEQVTIGTPLRARTEEFYTGIKRGDIVWVIAHRDGDGLPDRVEVCGDNDQASLCTSLADFEEVARDTLTHRQWQAGSRVMASLAKSYLERAYAAANHQYQPSDTEALAWLHKAADLRLLSHRLHVQGGDAGRW